MCKLACQCCSKVECCHMKITLAARARLASCRGIYIMHTNFAEYEKQSVGSSSVLIHQAAAQRLGRWTTPACTRWCSTCIVMPQQQAALRPGKAWGALSGQQRPLGNTAPSVACEGGQLQQAPGHAGPDPVCVTGRRARRSTRLAAAAHQQAAAPPQ